MSALAGENRRSALARANKWFNGVGGPDAVWALVALFFAVVLASGATWGIHFFPVVVFLLSVENSRRSGIRFGLGKLLLARLLLLGSLLAYTVSHGMPATSLLGVALASAATVLELLLRRIVPRGVQIAYNLPLSTPSRLGRVAVYRWVASINVLATLVISIALAARLTAMAEVAGCIAFGVLAVAFASVAVRIRSRFLNERELPAALEALAPQFALYWSAAPRTTYQISMWLPLLEQLDVPFVVVTRSVVNAEEAAALTAAPILYCQDPVDLDRVIVPSMSVAFYVNNAARNTQFVRYPGITHVMLNHGESDKPPSYNPVSRMYDVNFVAGQAAIDRFSAHGVKVFPDQFAIVGRPQLAGIDIGPRAGATSEPRPTVLYAPTWRGHTADAMHSSLDLGVEIVRQLIEMECDVMFRPHPYAEHDATHRRVVQDVTRMLEADAALPGRHHVFGPASERDLGVVEAINLADVLVSDTSSIVVDYLHSVRPIVLVTAQLEADHFIRENPLAEAAYIVGADLCGFSKMLRSALGSDPLRERRREMKTYYLGDAGRARVDTFLAAASELITASSSPRGVADHSMRTSDGE